MRLEPEEEPEPVDPGEFDAQFERGIELFNAGSYHEAHETFERLWVSTQNAEADFYKGLIQSSICLYHFQRGNPEGAKKLYSGHRKLLGAFLPVHHGLDLEHFLGAMQEALRPVMRFRDGEPPVFDPERRPQMQRSSNV